MDHAQDIWGYTTEIRVTYRDLTPLQYIDSVITLNIKMVRRTALRTLQNLQFQED